MEQSDSFYEDIRYLSIVAACVFLLIGVISISVKVVELENRLHKVEQGVFEKDSVFVTKKSKSHER